jgi:hypothetical protein
VSGQRWLTSRGEKNGERERTFHRPAAFIFRGERAWGRAPRVGVGHRRCDEPASHRRAPGSHFPSRTHVRRCWFEADPGHCSTGPGPIL